MSEGFDGIESGRARRGAHRRGAEALREAEERGEEGRREGGEEGESDQLYDQAIALVARERKCSTSFIQRYLQIGYNRAARIIEMMEREGVVGKMDGVRPREVLAPARSSEG